jgi:hypothetical protein
LGRREEYGQGFGGVDEDGDSVFDDGGAGVVDECFDCVERLCGFKNVYRSLGVDTRMCVGWQGEGVRACCVEYDAGLDLLED